jgi:hypothetical protein
MREKGRVNAQHWTGVFIKERGSWLNQTRLRNINAYCSRSTQPHSSSHNMSTDMQLLKHTQLKRSSLKQAQAKAGSTHTQAHARCALGALRLLHIQPQACSVSSTLGLKRAQAQAHPGSRTFTLKHTQAPAHPGSRTLKLEHTQPQERSGTLGGKGCRAHHPTSLAAR